MNNILTDKLNFLIKRNETEYSHHFRIYNKCLYCEAKEILIDSEGIDVTESCLDSQITQKHKWIIEHDENCEFKLLQEIKELITKEKGVI